MMLKEIKYIKGYSVTDDGQVIAPDGSTVEQFINACGYSCVWIDNRVYNVGTLVGDTYLNRGGCMLVKHKDGDRTNCNVDNLEWYFEGFDEGRTYGEDVDRGINLYSIDGTLLREYDSIDEAVNAFDVIPNSSLLYQMLSGHKRTAYGYVWRYRRECDPYELPHLDEPVILTHSNHKKR